MNQRQSAGLAALLWNQPGDDDAVAVVTRQGSTSWAEVRARAAGLAGALSGTVQPGDRVALFLDRGADAVAALFAIYAAGGVAVVVNERLRALQVEYVIRHCGARVLLTAADMLSRLGRPLDVAASILDVGAPGSARGLDPVPRRGADLAHIIYTSGSTGQPKGVVFAHGAIHTGIETVAGYLGLAAGDRAAWLLSLSSVYGLNQVLCAARTGSALVVENSALPHQIVTTLRALGTTVLAAVPPLWHQLLGVSDFERTPLTSLRLLQNAGGHLPVPSVQRLRAALPQARLFLQYGMTETFRSTFLPPEEADGHPGSMGRAIPGVLVRVVRDDGTPCTTGEVGELVHVGPTIADGYWNDPEETARRFRDDPQGIAGVPAARAVFSGDLVRREADGLLYWAGRRDRLIKSLGFRLSPDEIVEALHQSGMVTEAAVDTVADEERGEAIVAWVVLDAGRELATLRRYCRAELPRHMQPRTITAITRLPRLPSGKLDVAALREATAASPGTPGTPPQPGDVPPR